MENKNTIKFLGLFLIGLSLIAGIIILINSRNNGWNFGNTSELKKFNSSEELSAFLKQNRESTEYNLGGFFRGLAKTMAFTADSSAETSGGGDFSTTNIQVGGVDEADIVKNDGKYIYDVLSDKVIIVNANPAENLNILSEINISNVADIFIHGDELVIFSQENSYSTLKQAISSIWNYNPVINTKVSIYDVSDRENPKLKNEISIEGSYVESRMIRDYVYVISSKYIYNNYPEPPVYSIDGVKKATPANEVYYFDNPSSSYTFTSINAIDLSNGDFNSQVYLTGHTGTVYVSQDNIYLTNEKYFDYVYYSKSLIEEVYLKILPSSEAEKVREIYEEDRDIYARFSDIETLVYNYSGSLIGEARADFDKKLLEETESFDLEIRKEMEKTEIHKISVDGLEINYEAAGAVQGHLLNQFSMDEYKDYFRIATTTGDVWGGKSLNNIFVLDKNLKVIGSVEDLAPGEKIYSARFLGKRAYLVTFKKIDPFFVIDLENPKNPQVLGYLKIPGYSDYLHPYDENHIIGIGKETADPSSEDLEQRDLDFAWYQGVKIALFDVSDVENPKEQAKFVIGDRGTDSLALYEHKAFLFNKEKNLLVLPITLAEINKTKYSSLESIPPYAYGETVWQGAYVLNINEEEISLRGRITHEENFTKDEYGYYYGYNTQIMRSLYIGNVLYTLSNKMIKANNLESLEELKSLELPSMPTDYYRLYY